MLKKTLVKHSDSVNALAFSYDGSLFASGADDGLVIIFEGNGSGQEFRRFQVKAPVATLLWRSRFGYTLVAGDTIGDVHTISLSNSSRCKCIPLYFRPYMLNLIIREARIIIPSTMFLAQSTALHKVVHYWLSVQAMSYS